MTQEPNKHNTRFKLVNKRNYLLIARYYYWTEIIRARFDDVLKILSKKEFFVTERTITNALNDYDEFMNELLDNKTTSLELKKMFPSWNWENNPSLRKVYKESILNEKSDIEG